MAQAARHLPCAVSVPQCRASHAASAAGVHEPVALRLQVAGQRIRSPAKCRRRLLGEAVRGRQPVLSACQARHNHAP